MSKLSDFLGGAGGAGFGSLPVQVVSVDSTVDSNTSIGINTKDRVVTVTMPASPKIGDMLVFFDAALTWGINSVNVITNGHPVQYQTTNPSSFELREKGGILSLLFVDSITGWVDTSYYKNAAEPVWYPRVGEEKALHTLTGNHELLHTFNSSGEYIIPTKGLYVFRLAGGGGSGTSTVGDGGDTSININGATVARAKGGKSEKKNDSSYYEPPTLYLYQPLFGASASASKDDFYIRNFPTNTVLYGFQTENLPLAPFENGGGYQDTYAYGWGTISSSLALSLDKGNLVSAVVGAGAPATRRPGDPGKIEIYRIT